MTPHLRREHKWLQQLVGEWIWEHDTPPPEGGPSVKHVGTESVRSLGGLWVLLEGRSRMPDKKPAVTIMTLGFDPEKGRFVGTFVGSMMTYMWSYEGRLASDGKSLVLDTEGPSFPDTSKIVKYQDSVEIVSDDHRVLRSKYLADDGNWQEFMKADYRRVG
jgi:hypothetical protein